MTDPLKKARGLSWFERAINPLTPTTLRKETVRTASREFKGKEILFPTIRMINGELTELPIREAMEAAIQNKDFIEFDSPEAATKASKEISGFIGKTRSDFLNERNKLIEQVAKTGDIKPLIELKRRYRTISIND